MKTSIKIIHWTPRILCILSILFVSMFAADSFESENTIGQNLASLFMHLLPSIILTVLLIVAWKWEFIGGVIFIVLGIGMSPFIFMLNYNRNHFSIAQSLGIILMINFPFIFVGILFVINHYLKKRKTVLS
ncbi:MAG TPA: hypothetical protein VLR29_11320 [Flavobacterium sp.]|nr:hypothetical protein [Flavobacterium sp.]